MNFFGQDTLKAQFFSTTFLNGAVKGQPARSGWYRLMLSQIQAESLEEDERRKKQGKQQKQNELVVFNAVPVLPRKLRRKKRTAVPPVEPIIPLARKDTAPVSTIFDKLLALPALDLSKVHVACKQKVTGEEANVDRRRRYNASMLFGLPIFQRTARRFGKSVKQRNEFLMLMVA